MENNKKKILIYSVLGVVTLLIVTLTITYAYWILTREQTGENVVNTACLNITFTGENDITLDKAYPMNEEQLESFLSSATPYHFTIHNECSDLASATINLESLNAGAEKQLEDQYINAILYETNYHTNLNSEKKLIERIYNDENKVLENSLHAYSLYNFTLKANEEKDFNLLLYMDPETPMVEANMNASWKGKITLSTGYKEDSKALRKISSTDNQGMWGYKDKLNKIVIEDSKSEKEAPEGGVVYGPFDESEYGTKAVESYVVCETDDTNCVGYLQSNGKVVANSNSSSLFKNFNKVTEFENIGNLDTSKVTNMNSMFNGMNQLLELDLSNFDTSSLTNIISMFSGCNSLQSLDLSNWKFNNSISNSFAGASSLYECKLLSNIILKDIDLSKVTSMNSMFMSLKSVTSLDLSSFDTSHITSMSGIFSGLSNLQDLNLSNWDFSSLDSSFNPNLFSDNTNLETINLTNAIFPTNSSSFFSGGLTSLNNIILDNVDTSEVNDMSYMFDSLNLININVKSFNTENVRNMSSMFGNMKKIKTLDLSTLNTSNVANMNYIFNGLNELQELNISNWDLSSLNSSSSPNMFKNTNIATIHMKNVIFPVNSSEFFSGQSSLNNIILDGCDTSHVTNMSNMFYACFGLESLDLSSFDTNNVSNMDNMFSGTIKLQSITFGPKFVHKPEATTTNMFAGCPSQNRPTDDSWQGVSF